ncbi:MAG: hypothetical protein R3266_06750, partial [Gemmatimonadota bacterium]|nr:hypothetical protein [Gemmatimonadota bacterium]
VHRELAALRLQQGRYSEARRHAEPAWNLARGPQTMRLLAAARYLDGHDLAALDAWNALAPLRVDWVNFLGISRTNARRIVSRADLGTQEPLSAERLRTARRRVAQLPTLSSARVDYAPTDSGRVEIDIAIDEKRRWPMAWSVGVRAAWDGIFNERVRLEAAGPLGLDERWSLEYRWETARRRVEVGLEVPGSLFVPGVWRLEGGRERDSFATAPREERRGLSLGFSSWLASRFRMGLAAGWERFTDRGSWLSVSLAPTLALDGDRLIVRGEAHGWTDLGPATNFARLDLEAHWQSNPEPEGLVWRVRAGAATATALSPRSLWPGAGDGTADVPLLRAHRLAEGGVIDGPIFGRRLVHGGIESTWWGIDVAVLRLGAALFTDVGLAGGRPADAPGRGLQVDAGLGLRIDLPDVGRLRLDLARGLVDEALRLSAGLERDWEIVP